MKKFSYTVFLLIFLAGSFLAGIWYNQRNRKGIFPVAQSSQAASYESDSKEVLDVENVPGAVKISPKKQQLLGIRVGRAEKSSSTHSLRVLGRVGPDENRLYRLNASTELWIRRVYPPTTGSIVRKDEPLLEFYATNFLSAAASYIYALDTRDRQKASPAANPAQMGALEYQIRQAIENLQNLGVSDVQIAEMERTRKAGDLVTLRSLSNGFVLSRNVNLGQWVGPGIELYKIADLSRVWILADVYENEGDYLRPGMKVKCKLPYRNRTFEAKVSDVLPQFDPSTRTLKIRLETDNPGYILLPDMFVDVELPIKLPPAITVPSDAILDSGLKKTVFVNRGNGYFEPREVETGWRVGNRVEIIKGLEVGEKIVTSGTFLIDSESKLELAAQGMYTTLSKDPVCGLDVAIRKADKAGLKASYKGKTFYFNSEECKRKFEKEPEKYAKE